MKSPPLEPVTRWAACYSVSGHDSGHMYRLTVTQTAGRDKYKVALGIGSRSLLLTAEQARMLSGLILAAATGQLIADPDGV
jgi:hypothetical protein